MDTRAIFIKTNHFTTLRVESFSLPRVLSYCPHWRGGRKCQWSDTHLHAFMAQISLTSVGIAMTLSPLRLLF
jgi:hypothetical protein